MADLCNVQSASKAAGGIPSVEGKGAEPGKVDVYDLATFELVGSVGVGQQAGGIVFWRMDEGS